VLVELYPDEGLLSSMQKRCCCFDTFALNLNIYSGIWKWLSNECTRR